MRQKKPPSSVVQVRALRTVQGDGVHVYAFFMPGADITQIADISRVERDESDSLKGLPRKVFVPQGKRAPGTTPRHEQQVWPDEPGSTIHGLMTSSILLEETER